MCWIQTQSKPIERRPIIILEHLQIGISINQRPTKKVQENIGPFFSSKKKGLTISKVVDKFPGSEGGFFLDGASISTHLCPPLRSTFAVRETASLGIMGAPEVILLQVISGIFSLIEKLRNVAE